MKQFRSLWRLTKEGWSQFLPMKCLVNRQYIMSRCEADFHHGNVSSSPAQHPYPLPLLTHTLYLQDILVLGSWVTTPPSHIYSANRHRKSFLYSICIFTYLGVRSSIYLTLLFPKQGYRQFSYLKKMIKTGQKSQTLEN